MMGKGNLVVIVAPSGTGKSTLITNLKKEFPELKESVSFTTRSIREGEVNGIHYNFISEDEFLNKRKNDEFLEWATVHSNFYGTSKTYVEECLDKNESLLFDLDVQGADSFKKHFGKKANVIFIEPPSLEELKRRLLTRGTDSIDVINERVRNAELELRRKNDFDFLVMNKKFEQALSELIEIFSSILRNSDG